LDPPPQNNPKRLLRSSLYKPSASLVQVILHYFGKLLVAMKKHGDNNDSGAYMKAAGSLVDILVPYDNIDVENMSVRNLYYICFPSVATGVSRRRPKNGAEETVGTIRFHKKVSTTAGSRRTPIVLLIRLHRIEARVLHPDQAIFR
jgi:hypothetical protein